MRLEDVTDRCAAVAKSVDQFLAQHVNRRQLSRRAACPRGEQGRGGDRRGAVGFASVSMSCDSRTPQLVATVGAAAGAKGKKPEAGKGAKGGGAGKQASGAKKSGASSVKEAAQPGGFSLPFLLASMAAGATAGAAVESALYPIDTIKTRLQVARSGGGIVWKGLYKGLAGNIAGVIPASAIFMGVYEPVKRAVKDAGGSDLAAQFAAATLAGTAASLVRVPTEVVKQRMQMGEFASATGAVRAILAKEGLRRGLYAGYGSFLLRDLPFDAIEFIAYEQAKSAYKAFVHGRELNPAEHSAIGALAGVSTAVLTTPLDVIKTRLMTQGAAGRYKGIIDCCRTLVREEGAAALMKGVGPRVTWIGIGGSVFFTCLEASKKVFLPLAGAA